MSQQETAKVHHYSARIPDSDYARARAKCDKMGISMNTGLIHALRHWCKTTDSAVPIPVHAKLSDVIGGMLQEMEARIMAAIQAPGPELVKVSIEAPEGCTEELVRKALASMPRGLHTGGYVGSPGAEVPSILQAEQLVDAARAQKYERQVEKANRLGLSYGTGKPTQFTTVPERLNWDTPAPQHRLWPENPPVNSLAPRPLDGQVWVVTGDFDTMTTSRVREILSEAGAAVASQVSKKTSAVLAGYSGEKEVLSAGEFRMLPIWGELQFLHMAKFIGADVRIPE